MPPRSLTPDQRERRAVLFICRYERAPTGDLFAAVRAYLERLRCTGRDRIEVGNIIIHEAVARGVLSPGADDL